MSPPRPRRPEAVFLGGSAGALEVLVPLVRRLPPGYRLPVVVVLHLPEDVPSLVPAVLADGARVRVAEIVDKQPIEPGTVWVAPPGYHLLVEGPRTFALSADERVHFSRPSIDVLFESAADVYGAGCVAALLAGANEDGAAGLAAIARRGGVALVQDPATAASPAMPQAGLAAAGAHPLAPAALADYLLALASDSP